MSRKKKTPEAVPAEILAEGSGPAKAPDITDDAEVGMPVEVAADADPKPPKRKSRKRAAETELGSAAIADADADADADVVASVVADADADVTDINASEVVDADELGAAIDARADDVADDLAAASEPGDDASADEAPAAGDASDAGDGEVAEGPVLPAAMDAVQLRRLVEALIFATDRPITLQRLRQLSRISDVKRIEQALAELAEEYADRGIALHQVSGGYQFRTNTAFSPWVQQLIAGRPVRLSRAQLETLAIIAYRQPITRPEIDEIRGVDSSATLRLLLDRALVRVLGKREEVGRPILYGTTKEFLDFFSLSDLRELPTLREYSELTAESRQVMSDRLGVPLGEEPGSIGEMGVGIGDIDVGIGRPAGDDDVPGDPADLAGSFPAASAAAAADASDAAIDAAFERDDTGTDDDAVGDGDDDSDELSASSEDDSYTPSHDDHVERSTTSHASSADDPELASATHPDELEDSLSARAARRLRELDDRDAGDAELASDANMSELETTELDPGEAIDPIETAAELDPATFDHEPGEPAHEPIDEPNE